MAAASFQGLGFQLHFLLKSLSESVLSATKKFFLLFHGFINTSCVVSII